MGKLPFSFVFAREFSEEISVLANTDKSNLYIIMLLTK